MFQPPETQTPRQGEQAAPTDRADAAKYRLTTRHISGQSTPASTPRAGAATQRPSSPAAGSGVRNERSCRRSGAAPCCAAVMTLCLTLPRRQSTLKRAEKSQPPKTKTRTRAGKPRDPKPKTPRQSRRALAAEAPTRVLAENADNFQRPKYFDTMRPSKRSSTTTKLTRRRKPVARNERRAVGGRVQRLVVLLLIRFTQTPRQSHEAAPTDRADAANLYQKRPTSSGQSTPASMPRAGAEAQRPSSPAAGSGVRNERSCRRSGAAPCCLAVDDVGVNFYGVSSTFNQR